MIGLGESRVALLSAIRIPSPQRRVPPDDICWKRTELSLWVHVTITLLSSIIANRGDILLTPEEESATPLSPQYMAPSDPTL
jgi:hypothetical protein